VSSNLNRYRDPVVVDFYASRHRLDPAEKTLIDKYLKQGARTLDLGVGAGRTTPYLSARASQYVGVDYSFEMLHTCRKRFPGVNLVQADASELSMFVDNSFDAVVFSFNGIGFIESDSLRRAFLEHCRRILAGNGCFIFSCHNADYLYPRPIPARSPVHRGWRWFRRVIDNRDHVWRTLRSGVFLKGEGYTYEPAHGGLKAHYATPEKVKIELARAGFRVVEVLPHGFPQLSGPYNTPWYHYACIK
jgi:SAM-dependent methyltransferase